MSCLLILGTVMLCEYLLASSILAFTARTSTLRQLCLLCLVILAIIEIRLLSFLPGPELLRGIFAFSCIVKILHFTNLFSILQVEIQQLIPETSSASSTRFYAALNCTTSIRGIGTPWECITHRNCQKPLTRGTFIAKTLIVLAWQYLAIDLLNFGALRYFHRYWPDALTPGAEFIGPGSTWNQLIARLPLACILLANLRLLFAMVYGVLAVAGVTFGLTRPQDWPPLFGSWDDFQTFSLRSFWAKYWHQLLRWPLKGISAYIRQCLRLQISASRREQTFVDLVLVFTLSGILHVLSAAYSGSPYNAGAIFLFFFLNSFVILLEDLYRAQVLGGSYPHQGLGLPGFLWELIWFYVGFPWFAYTALRLPVELNPVMPFSFVEQFGSPAVMIMVLSGGVLWALGGEDIF